MRNFATRRDSGGPPPTAQIGCSLGYGVGQVNFESV